MLWRKIKQRKGIDRNCCLHNEIREDLFEDMTLRQMPKSVEIS